MVYRNYIAIVIALMLVGCSPKIVERIVVQHDTTLVHRRDSVFFRDSVYVKEWLKGDTVYIEKYKDRYVYKDRWRDSIRVKEVHDTTTVEKRVEKELTPMQRLRINSFWPLLAASAILLCWTFRKRLLCLIRKLL